MSDAARLHGYLKLFIRDDDMYNGDGVAHPLKVFHNGRAPLVDGAPQLSVHGQ